MNGTKSEEVNKNAEQIVSTLQQLVNQATLNRLKVTMERELVAMNYQVNVMISTTIKHPKPIFLHLEDMEEIPMDIFDWISDFSNKNGLKYVNSKGNLFALFLKKDYDDINEIQTANTSLYSIYRKERASILQREKMSEESLYTYNVKKILK